MGVDAGKLEALRYPAGTIGFYSWNVQENSAHGDDVIAYMFGVITFTCSAMLLGFLIDQIVKH